MLWKINVGYRARMLLFSTPYKQAVTQYISNS